MPKGLCGFQKGHGAFPGTEATRFKKGQVSHNKGKHPPGHPHSEESKEKIRQSKIELYKDKTRHPKWLGGISEEKWYSTLKSRQRKIKRLGNGGSHTNEEWEDLKKNCNYMCQICKRCEPEIKLTKDHIIPISKDGRDDIENIQPLCRACNSSKGTKIITNKNNIMSIYKKESEVRGAWVKKEELKNGMKAVIKTETIPSPSTFTDDKGVMKTQDVCKVKFEGLLEDVNVSLNKATIKALVDAFGEDSNNWIGKELTVEVEKMRVGGKAVLAMYLIPDGFHKYDDADGYAKIGRNTEGVDEQMEDLPY